jgi:hypothetical protein
MMYQSLTPSLFHELRRGSLAALSLDCGLDHLCQACVNQAVLCYICFGLLFSLFMLITLLTHPQAEPFDSALTPGEQRELAALPGELSRLKAAVTAAGQAVAEAQAKVGGSSEGYALYTDVKQGSCGVHASWHWHWHM